MTMLRLYRLALRLCPPAFRRDFGEAMLIDAADARADAVADGAPLGLWRWRVQMTLDLVRTVLAQWMRTGVPLVALVMIVMLIGAAIPLVALTALGALAHNLLFELPATLRDADVIGVVLLSALLVCVITMTIVITYWTTRMQRRVRR